MAHEKSLAFIREDECIGCMKCIDVCPVDAILGANKFLHTVIADECIGCKLCVPVCPVDCIDLVPSEAPRIPPEHVKNRYQARQKRLDVEKKQWHTQDKSLAEKQNYIQSLLKKRTPV